MAPTQALSGLAARWARKLAAVRETTGRRRALLAFLAGAIGATAMPPLHFAGGLVIAMTFAVLLIDGAWLQEPMCWRRRFRRNLATGWLFGFGYFLAGLWWLGAAFLVEAERFALLMPLGVVGLPALLAAFPALAFAAAGLIWSTKSRRILALAAAFGVIEWLRGMAFTGFPWNPPGLAFAAGPPFDQIVSVMGIHGLNLVAVLIGAAPAVLLDDRACQGRVAMPGLALALLAGMAIFGLLRLHGASDSRLENTLLRIMQPDLQQDQRFRPEFRESVLDLYLATSAPAGGRLRPLAEVSHLFWPESAFPFILQRDPAALRRLADFLPGRTRLVTGAARLDPQLPGENRLRFYNSILALNSEAEIDDVYDKSHLVPFGEYLPAEHVLRALGLRQFIAVPGGFTAGRTRRTLSIPGLPPVVALICYEAIFPRHAFSRGDRAGLIVNVTNDAWFGQTPGPHQHFALARLRAIEQGIPMIRAANSGISAIIDPFGRSLVQLPLGQRGAIESRLPVALSDTIYASFGDGIFALMVVCTLLVALPRARFGLS
jgi:apolipoprotein N-acyltransferase